MEMEIVEAIMEADLPPELTEVALTLVDTLLDASDTQNEIKLNIYETAGVSSFDELIEKAIQNRPEENVAEVKKKVSGYLGKIKLLKVLGINFDDKTGTITVDKEKFNKRKEMAQKMLGGLTK